MKIEHHQEQGIEIFSLSGTMDSTAVNEIDKSLTPYVADESITKILINFKEVSFIDSGRFGMLAASYNKIKHRDGRFVFCELKNSLMSSIKLTGLNNIFEIYDTEEAVSKLVEYVEEGRWRI